ncbi:MAG: hypothetical protein M3397_01865 [Actinomycetota bacterium]|nr:hypothetical protein [Actinomycetota bacterium]
MSRRFANIPAMSKATVGILVDYESPIARRVASAVWSGLSWAALDAGHASTTALWESLRETRAPEKPEGTRVHIFVVGQDHPDAIDNIGAIGDLAAPHLYGLVVAVPERASPLAGSLLYQGVERLTDSGVKPGAVEPALLHAFPEECERYARRLLERLRVA